MKKKKGVFIWEGERDQTLSSYGLFLKCVWFSGLSHAHVRNQPLISGLLRGWQGPKYTSPCVSSSWGNPWHGSWLLWFESSMSPESSCVKGFPPRLVRWGNSIIFTRWSQGEEQRSDLESSVLIFLRKTRRKAKCAPNDEKFGNIFA